MRVFAANASALAPAAAAARRASGTTFSVPAERTAPAPGGAGAVRTLGGIEALIALQSVEDATERRRRAVGRGRAALDALEDIKVALLAGGGGERALARLRAVAVLEKDTGDARLDAVLAEIELRAQVELAKVAKAQADATRA